MFFSPVEEISAELNNMKTFSYVTFNIGFPGGSVVKNPPANAGDTSSILGLERSPGEGNGNTFQYFGMENPMDRGAYWATIYGVSKELAIT